MIQLNVFCRPKCDSYVASCLLKQWLRQLPSSIIPPEFYPKCLAAVSSPEQCCELTNRLPYINRLVIATLISLLQRLCNENVVKETKMDASNLVRVTRFTHLIEQIFRPWSWHPTFFVVSPQILQ